MVLPQGRDWAAHQAAARRRLEFQSWMHTWLLPLADALHGQPLPVLDGGYGDALLRADMAGKAAAHDLPWPLSQFQGSGGRRLEFLAEQARPVLFEAATQAHAVVAAGVADHANRETLLQLLTRQNRAVTTAARLLVGPETEVWLPFTHPTVVRGGARGAVGRQTGPGVLPRDAAHRVRPRGRSCGPATTMVPRPEEEGRLPPAGARRLADGDRTTQRAGDRAAGAAAARSRGGRRRRGAAPPAATGRRAGLGGACSPTSRSSTPTGWTGPAGPPRRLRSRRSLPPVEEPAKPASRNQRPRVLRPAQRRSDPQALSHDGVATPSGGRARIACGSGDCDGFASAWPSRSSRTGWCC